MCVHVIYVLIIILCGFFFGNRIVDEWNLVSEDAVSSTTVNSFKNNIDQYVRCCRGCVCVKHMAITLNHVKTASSKST